MISPQLFRRGGVLLAGLGLVTSLSVSPSVAVADISHQPPTTPIGAQDGGGATASFAACVQSQGGGDVLLLIDESGSLEDSDPGAARVTAASSLVDEWSSLGQDIDLQVAVAGFADAYEPAIGWTALDEGGSSRVTEALASFSDRTQGQGTDYWMALQSARSELAQRRDEAPDRCQAVVWFSDGELDVSPTYRDGDATVVKPYLDDSEVSRARATEAALAGLCAEGGVADQLRSGGVVTLGIGLATGGTAPEDLDTMRAITTGTGEQQTCGALTNPVPGEFRVVSDIDSLIEAFHRLRRPGEEPKESTSDICQNEICPAQHRFVLDSSVRSVHILATSTIDRPDVYLVPPEGDPVAVPWGQDDAEHTFTVGDARGSAQSLTDRTMTLTLSAPDGATPWSGQWGLAIVDPSGQSPKEVSRTLLWISGDLRPTIEVRGSQGEAGTIRTGESALVRLGLESREGNAVSPDSILGTMSVDLYAVPRRGDVVSVAEGLSAQDVAEPIRLDLENEPVGPLRLRADLQITTAAAENRNGKRVPGTEFAVERAERVVQIEPPAGFPTIEPMLDFGEVEGDVSLSAELSAQGPGCVWFDLESASIEGVPAGVGAVDLDSEADSAEACVAVEAGAQGQVPLTLTTQSPGNGAVHGTVTAFGAPTEELDRGEPVEVAFSAEISKPRSVVRGVLAFVLTFLLGLAIPLVLLYLARRRSAVIPPRALMQEEIDITVTDQSVLRDGEPLRLHPQDLRQMVSIPEKGSRDLSVGSARLRSRTGWSPLGEAYVQVDTPGAPVVTSTTNVVGSGDTGRLPVAVHNNWVAWPTGQTGQGRLLLLVGPDANDEQRAELVRSVQERLPALFQSGSGDGDEVAKAPAATSGGWDDWDDSGAARKSSSSPPEPAKGDGWDDVEFRFDD